jgi:galactitol-specific phosphotransferase system IIB component
LGTSETINEKIEEIMRQMNDLHVEIKSNIDLVQEKKRLQAKDINQFIRVLCEDVKQFLSCMTDDLAAVYQAIDERDHKCRMNLRDAER